MNRILAAICTLLVCATSAAAEKSLSSRIDEYLAPYVSTKNFAGSVIVVRDGRAIFSRSYGWADTESKKTNAARTRFHVGSMSMQFTAAAVLRLVDAGKLSLDSSVADVLPDFPNGANITIRNLLMQTSGIADLNDFAEYPQILKSHHDAADLVALVRERPALHAPGGAYTREEHSAYNLLALIVEKRTGLSFAAAEQHLVFAPLGMNDSGIDDDQPIVGLVAKGYAPRGVFDLQPAESIKWSAKTGNGSAYSTTLDEEKWLRGLFDGKFLSPSTKAVMFDLSTRVGFGWFKFKSRRFETPLYSMNGRAPGFASAIVYFPEKRVSVVVLSNIYASVTTQIGDDVAALVLDKAYQSLNTRSVPLGNEALSGISGHFRFGTDFYQPGATLQLEVLAHDVALRWPNGDVSALIPVDDNHFIDRSYWVPVEILRDSAGKMTRLKYDRFTGEKV